MYNVCDVLEKQVAVQLAPGVDELVQSKRIDLKTILTIEFFEEELSDKSCISDLTSRIVSAINNVMYLSNKHKMLTNELIKQIFSTINFGHESCCEFSMISIEHLAKIEAELEHLLSNDEVVQMWLEKIYAKHKTSLNRLLNEKITNVFDNEHEEPLDDWVNKMYVTIQHFIYESIYC